MPGRVLFPLSNLANRPFWNELLRSKSSKFGPNDRRKALNRTLSTVLHHPARLVLGVCGQHAKIILSLHARDLVLVVRERIRKSQLRVYDGSRACFRERFVVMPSKNATNSCRAVSAQPGNFCRVRAPGNLAGNFFVAGQFGKVFSKILQIARFGLGNF